MNLHSLPSHAVVFFYNCYLGIPDKTEEFIQCTYQLVCKNDT